MSLAQENIFRMNDLLFCHMCIKIVLTKLVKSQKLLMISVSAFL